MDSCAVKKRLSGIIDKRYVLENEPLSRHTTFKIGGPAAVMLTPDSPEVLCSVVKALHGTPFTVIGNGSNLLVHDEGYDGTVIKIGSLMSGITCEDNVITAGAGALLSRVGAFARDNGLGGFEFASGIPGSLGGGVCMNAGAYGGELKDVVISSEYIDEAGCFGVITDHCFSYRHSIYSGGGKIITSVKIRLERKPCDEIQALMDDLKERRKTKQPLEYPSAGSTFKRPEGYFAAKLIDDAGLRGYICGGACVSEKHCGFVVNKGGATFHDVMSVMEHVKNTVYEKFGVVLDPEVKIL